MEGGVDCTRILELLDQWEAPAHLVRHLNLVAEVAGLLVEALQQVGLPLDRAWVEAAALLHDVGKLQHPEELHQPGHLHEEAGQQWVRERLGDESLARVCLSHARWRVMSCSNEELVVALADKLWKGKRVPELEERLIREVAAETKQEFWALFPRLDLVFEELAAGGQQRLARSLGSQ